MIERFIYSPKNQTKWPRRPRLIKIFTKLTSVRSATTNYASIFLLRRIQRIVLLLKEQRQNINQEDINIGKWPSRTTISTELYGWVPIIIYSTLKATAESSKEKKYQTLIVSSQFAITIDLRAEYSVWSCLSSTDQNLWNINVFSYLQRKNIENRVSLHRHYSSFAITLHQN